MAALVARLQEIAEGEVAATARRAGISRRQLVRIRGGDANVTLETLERLAAALGEHPLELLGGAVPRRRAAPIGHRQGKPRGIRREIDLWEPWPCEEDAPDGREEV